MLDWRKRANEAAPQARSKLFQSTYSFHLLVKWKLMEGRVVDFLLFSYCLPASRTRKDEMWWMKRMELRSSFIPFHLFSFQPAERQAGQQRKEVKIDLFLLSLIVAMAPPITHRCGFRQRRKSSRRARAPPKGNSNSTPMEQQPRKTTFCLSWAGLFPWGAAAFTNQLFIQQPLVFVRVVEWLVCFAARSAALECGKEREFIAAPQEETSFLLWEREVQS